MFRDKSTGAGAISKTVSPNKDGALDSVRIQLSGASAAENFVVSIVSASGSEYNVPLNTKAMSALTSYVYQPTRPIPFFSGDQIKIAYANSNLVTYGLEILWI